MRVKISVKAQVPSWDTIDMNCLLLLSLHWFLRVLILQDKSVVLRLFIPLRNFFVLIHRAIGFKCFA